MEIVSTLTGRTFTIDWTEDMLQILDHLAEIDTPPQRVDIANAPEKPRDGAART